MENRKHKMNDLYYTPFIKKIKIVKGYQSKNETLCNRRKINKPTGSYNFEKCKRLVPL